MAKKEKKDKDESILNDREKARAKAKDVEEKSEEKAEEAKTEEAKAETKSTEPKKEEKTESEADRLEKELAAAKEAHIRTLAEYDNYRKRSTREKEAAYGDSKANVLKELLTVLDNIDRAASLSTEDAAAYKKGVDMIFSSFTSTLEKLGLESFGAPGDSFDPNIHNAVMHIDDEDLPENSVTDVFSKGYKLGDRILRPAMVKVAN